MQIRIILASLLIFVALMADGALLVARAQQGTRQASDIQPRDLLWSDLVPADWDQNVPIEGSDLQKLRDLADDDPRAQAALARLRAAWGKAPIAPALNGVHARIPGFVVALETTSSGITEFLLVPYFGACIHTPPPPANQIVHVFARQPVPSRIAAEPVWVSGRIEITTVETPMGRSGYAIRSAVVTTYQPPTGDRKARVLRFGTRSQQRVA